MEEKCAEETLAINLTTSNTSTETIANAPLLIVDNIKSYFSSSPPSASSSSSAKPLTNSFCSEAYFLQKATKFEKATTSRSSMSLLQEEFESNSQHAFAEVVLDDETTTSGLLEPYDISSSNLILPSTTNDDVTSESVAVADDSSSTDLQIIKVTDSSSGSSLVSNNEFFTTSEVYVINDDDDDDEVDDDDDDDDDDIVEEDDDDTVGDVVESNLDSDHNNIIEEDDIENEEDDDEDEDGDMNTTNQSSSSRNIQITNASGSHTNAINNGVIMSTNGAMIFLETPVVEDQQHHHHMHHHHPQMSNNSSDGCTNNFASDKNVKPKRLSDEFSKDSGGVGGDMETPTSSSTATGRCKQVKQEHSDSDVIYDLSESRTCSENEHMSSRLKKMNLNNGGNCKISQDTRPSSSSTNPAACKSSSIVISSLSDIESMDLIERRDFENEQRLTGGIILKSSSLMKEDVLNLGLVKSQSLQLNENSKPTHNVEDYPASGSHSHTRRVSSDSKCTYKDLSVTPTSSRKLIVRLTKSTAKMNLCNTLSQNQQQKQLYQQEQNTLHHSTEFAAHNNSNSNASSQNLSSCVASSIPATSSSSSLINSNSTSVIVEPTSSVASDIYSNSNSNDSLTSRPSSTTSSNANKPTNTQCKDLKTQEYAVGPSTSTSSATVASKPSSSSSSVVVRVFENGCSRTSAIQPIVNNSNHSSNSSSNNIIVEQQGDDVQPSTSTSSARCQYAPPPRNQRHVNASAQTNERYLSSRPAAAGGINSSNTGDAAGPSELVCTNRNNNGGNRRRSSELPQNLMNGLRMLNDHLDPNYSFSHQSSAWVDCDENNSDIEEICTCHQQNLIGDANSLSGSIGDLNEIDDLDNSHNYSKDGGGDLNFNIMQNLSISEDLNASIECNVTRKRKYNDSRLMDHDYNSAPIIGSGGTAVAMETNSRKRIAYDFTSTPRSSQAHNSGSSLVHVSSPSAGCNLMTTALSGSPLGRRTPRSLIPTRDNPPPELQQWLLQFQRWSHVERLLAVDRLIEHCEPTQVRHMMKVIEPQFQRDFISLLPRELALQVLSYLDPKDLLRAAQTCRSWRFLCDDNLLWKEKCRTGQILTEARTDRPKRGRAGNMPPIASPWKAAYMRQHIIEMNWRSRPIRRPKVLKGHDEHVITCLQFSGNRIVSGSDDNTLKVWSAVTGRCLRTLVGHTGGVWSSQMSGNIIISGSTDRTLKVWDMETGQCVHTLMGHTSTVRCMHLHGNKVVSGSRDATLRVWDIEQGTCSRVLVGHLAAVRCVQYDGKLIVSGAYDYMVKIWHPERSECLHTLQGHTNRVYSLQFDGVHVVSGSLDTSIRVWDVETGNCKHTLMGHQSLTSGMELRENILVSGNADSTVKVWDITTGQCLQTLSGPNKHQSAVTCLQFNSRFVVTSSDDGTVKLWDVKTGEFIRNLVSLESGGSGGVVWRIRANDTKLICAVGSRNGTEETKLMVLDFDVEGACVKCS